ncbi:MAG TPA: ACT domain-containing protein, partial [Paraburkholderia sp.]|nr:ACT domain-containing protein [Paraburkholderia sp.]
VPHLAFQPDSLSNTPILPIDEVTSGYYLRLRVADQTGVMAAITRILADSGISIDALLQKEAEQVDAQGKAETDIILITHETIEKNVNAAIAQIETLATVKSPVTKLRMEGLN